MFDRTSGIGVLGLALATLTAGTAQAGLLSANSGGAIPAYTGSQTFSGGFSTFTVNAEVDYAVFAPGDFGVAFPGLDPSGGNEFVYAYQVENTDLANTITKLTVGLDGDEPLGSIGFIPDVGLHDPVTELFVGAGPTSAAWDFTASSPLPVGVTSAVLIFTSAAGPEWDTGTTHGAFADEQALPSPAPEPASLALMAMGLGVMGSRQLTRK